MTKHYYYYIQQNFKGEKLHGSYSKHNTYCWFELLVVCASLPTAILNVETFLITMNVFLVLACYL